MFPKKFPPPDGPKMKYTRWHVGNHQVEGWKSYIWNIYMPYKCFYLLGMVIFAYKYWGDFNLIVGVLVTFPVAVESLVKTLILKFRHRKIDEMLKIIDTKFWDSSITSGEALKTITGRYKLIDAALVVHASIGFCSAIFVSLFPAAKYPEGIKQLPGVCWFPFDTNPFPIHQILYAIFVWNNFMGYYSNVCFDFGFIYSAEHMICQFIAIQYCLENIIGKKEEATAKSEENQSILYERLKICIRHHNLLLQFVKELEKLYSGILMIQLPLTFLSLVTTGYFVSVIGFDDLFTSSNLLFYGCTRTVQLFSFCFYGSEILDESSKILGAAYKSRWATTSIPFQKSMLILMMNVREGIQITAGGMTPLTNNTIISVYRTVFSCVTLLKQMQAELIH